MCVSQFDPPRTDDFAQKLTDTLNHAGLALMISLGHRTALFDTMAKLPAATSDEIAEEAELNERYVREWLAAMVTGGIVEHDPRAKTYLLPPEHAVFLTRSSPNNFAAGMQFISVLGHVEDDVLAAFRHGLGVPYSAYPRFHEVMAEESAQTVVAGLAEFIVPLVPELAERLARGSDVLDIGCGSGLAMIHLARRYPRSNFTGYDFSGQAVARAHAEAERQKLTNVRFEVRDAAAMMDRERYDLVTAFDAIHDQAKPADVLKNIRRALRPGGVFLMQDIAGTSDVHRDCEHPLATFLYTVSTMHCMSVSLAGGGPGLGAMWGRETALTMLRAAGFPKTLVESLPHDVMNFYYVSRV